MSLITIDELVKLNNLTIGRDKLARLIQYATRVLWHIMQKKHLNRQTVDKLKSLEYVFSSFRKLLRLGRFVDSLYGALNTIHYPDTLVRVTCTLSRLSNALYLFCDHILWIGRTGFIDVNVDRWYKTANKYWLYVVVMNLVRDAYEINNILDCGRKKNLRQPIKLIVSQHKDIIIDTVKNACDFFIPLTALGYTDFSPGVIGILGMVSSIAGIAAIVDPMLKLTPS